MLLTGLLVLASSQGAGIAITAASTVVVDSRDIRLGDILDRSASEAALPAGIADRVVARIAPDRSRVTVERRSLASIARRAVPALAPSSGEGQVTFELHTTRRAPANRCVALANAVPAGRPLSPDDLETVACSPSASTGAVSYDRAMATVRAGTDLAQGTYLGRLTVAPPAVPAGTKLTLVSRAGPVQVERQVKALQPGHHGRRVFVADADGQVFAVRLADRPGEAQ